MDSFDLDSSPVMPHSLPLEQDDRTGTMNESSDLDLDLDLDIKDDLGQRDIGASTAVDTGNMDLDMDADEWIEFDSVHSDETPTHGQGPGVQGLSSTAEVSSSCRGDFGAAVLICVDERYRWWCRVVVG
jgi:hypothetical protein